MNTKVTESTKDGEHVCDCSRRSFLKLFGAGAAGVMALGADPARAAETAGRVRGEEAMGVLVDTTLCIGCRCCEDACNEVNGLPKPKVAYQDDDSLLEQHRDTSPTAFTVVNKYTLGKGVEITRKQQCMHCLEPACSSACIIRAMEKQPDGAVTYRNDLCLGCRYCMLACPFDAPKFEYSKASPLIKKCQFCFERLEQGKLPACVEACPQEALKFGKRSDLIQEAKKRIHDSPDAYVDHIYGEHEAGGTSWLYLAGAPFEKLGLPQLDEKDYPELTSGAMATVPTVLLIWPALLAGFRHFALRRQEAHEERSKRHV
ncbi:MAG TPA: 4Fe-4S dicluster domain-containing protein [Syntrophobacteraceae bacterium]|nr:4Fe-4S dicluster domain-containing protein [Syntrophobacteraceae bacterium]